MRYTSAIIALTFTVVSSSLSIAEEDSLYTQLGRAVIRLEHIELAQQDGKPALRYIPDGTAFFVHASNELFVVTARHVVDKPHNLQARVECVFDNTNVAEVILLELPRDKWTFHNNQGDQDTHPVDVAVMRINGIKERHTTAFRYEPIGSTQEEQNQLPKEDPAPPQPILVFGFPADIGFGLLEQRPLGRAGVVSMKTDKEFLQWDGKFGEERCTLIDARIFSGNSGSPVMNQQSITDPKPKLLGLVIASNPSLDFAIIEPSSRIRETIELARKTEPSGTWKPIPGGKPNKASQVTSQ